MACREHEYRPILGSLFTSEVKMRKSAMTSEIAAAIAAARDDDALRAILGFLHGGATAPRAASDPGISEKEGADALGGRSYDQGRSQLPPH